MTAIVHGTATAWPPVVADTGDATGDPVSSTAEGSADQPGAAPGRRQLAGRDPVVGAEARRLYHDHHLYHGAKYPPYPILFYPGIKQLFLLLAILWVAIKAAPVARRATGRSILRQLADLLALGFRDGVDPVTYYLQELSRAGGRAEAAYCLTRYESKNGLLYALNHLRPSPFPRNEMNDKLLFAECCERYGLPTPPILLTVQGDAVVWRAAREALDRDLFCKFRQSSGARGTLLFRRIAPERYRGPDGRERTLDEVIDFLKPRTRAKTIMVQARMANHPSLAALAIDSLVTIRVLTCLDAGDTPEATHGILRIMKKLEPTWQGGPDDEYGAPIDIETGRLGLLTGDKLQTHPFRFARHPKTGDVVAGLVLDQWPAIRALALAAHARFAHRVVIGWDIALTDRGPVILEGNTNFDVMFFQRVYRRPVGRTRLGELLNHHLAVLHRAKLDASA